MDYERRQHISYLRSRLVYLNFMASLEISGGYLDEEHLYLIPTISVKDLNLHTHIGPKVLCRYFSDSHAHTLPLLIKKNALIHSHRHERMLV